MTDSKWILYARSFQGVIVMALTVALAKLGVTDAENVGALVESILTTGTFTIGMIWSIVGTSLRTKKVTILKP